MVKDLGDIRPTIWFKYDEIDQIPLYVFSDEMAHIESYYLHALPQSNTDYLHVVHWMKVADGETVIPYSAKQREVIGKIWDAMLNAVVP